MRRDYVASTSLWHPNAHWEFFPIGTKHNSACYPKNNCQFVGIFTEKENRLPEDDRYKLLAYFPQ